MYSTTKKENGYSTQLNNKSPQLKQQPFEVRSTSVYEVLQERSPNNKQQKMSSIVQRMDINQQSTGTSISGSLKQHEPTILPSIIGE